MKTKHYSTALLFTLFSTAAFAQTEKGKIVLSGKTDMSFLFSKVSMMTDSVKTGEGKTRQFNATAGAGYFLAKDLSLGIYGTYSYNYSNDQSPYGSQSITESYTILPQLQYYFPLFGNLKPFAGIGAGYVWLQERDSRITDNNNKVYSLGGPVLSAALGVSYFITPAVSFDLNVQYTYGRLQNKLWKDQIQKQQQMGGNLGVSVFFK